MKNAHLRMGTLQFHKVTRDTTIDVRLWMDRLIAEHEDGSHGRAKAHLISVFGGDQVSRTELSRTERDRRGERVYAERWQSNRPSGNRR